MRNYTVLFMNFDYREGGTDDFSMKRCRSAFSGVASEFCSVFLRCSAHSKSTDKKQYFYVFSQ